MALLRILSLFLISLEANLFPPDPYPGEVVKIVILSQSDSLRVSFNGKEYPSYPISKGSCYSLLGISYNIKPGYYNIWIKGKGDSTRFPIEVKEKEFPIEIWRYRVRRRLYPSTPKTKKERNIIREAIATESSKKLYKNPFMLPVKGRVTSPYGTYRITKGGEGGTRHRGVDIAAPRGTPILAPARGRIILTGRFRIHGRTVVIDHGQGVVSIYLHLSRILVNKGEMVEKGQVIGKLGSTGASTGPHLHWGLYIHGEPVNPLFWTKGGWETELG